MRISQRRFGKKGFVLVYLLIMMMLIISVGLVISSAIITNYRFASDNINRLHAQLAVDAGVDYAVTKLNTDQEWSGTAGEIELYDNGFHRTVYEVSVIDVDEQHKTLDAHGRTYASAGSGNLLSTKDYTIDLRGVGGMSGASVVTGVGGLEMRNTSKIVGGMVYINGTITMSNSAQIGLADNPVYVRAAHSGCPTPPDASYPRVCASGENGQPISLSNSAHIYAEVQATNQTDGSGMSGPGLVSGNPSPIPLPSHDRIAQINAITNTMTGAAASCTTNNGAKVWPANLKITGNVTINKRCSVTISGDVWISGNLTIATSGVIATADAVGTTMPNMMIDGSNGLVMGQSSRIISNASNTSPIVITYYSTLACSTAVTLGEYCDVTGANLYNSRNLITIDISNGSSGPETVFYARWSKVNIDNSGSIGSLVAQTVYLQNSSTITFGSAVPGVVQPPVWIIEGVRRG